MVWVSYIPKSNPTSNEIVSGNETREEIDKKMQALINKFFSIFTDITGKSQGEPMKILLKADASPAIQPPCRIPTHYRDILREEFRKMKEEDIIEGPITNEEPGTFLSNSVITDKKDTHRIRVTLNFQAFNKLIYPTHKPVSKLNMINCCHQFEIEPSARKLYAFHSPLGIYQYEHMLMGTSPASSEIQKRIRETIKDCKSTIHIKDYIWA